MATKYWVGGTGTWDATTRTNWADSSGGTGGAIAPCSLDDVVFDSASNATAYTVTISANSAVCRDLTIAGPASGNVTVNFSSQSRVYGNLTIASTGVTRTNEGTITFAATTNKTITTNGVSLGNIAFDGVGGNWTLGSALTCGSINITNGTFNTANYNLTAGQIIVVASLTVGSSTVTGTVFLFAISATFNAGTSSV